MRAIEFIAKAKEGFIDIPKEYREQLGDNFRIIILQDSVSDLSRPSKKKRLLNAVAITTKDLIFNRDEANER